MSEAKPYLPEQVEWRKERDSIFPAGTILA